MNRYHAFPIRKVEGPKSLVKSRLRNTSTKSEAQFAVDYVESLQVHYLHEAPAMKTESAYDTMRYFISGMTCPNGKASDVKRSHSMLAAAEGDSSQI